MIANPQNAPTEWVEMRPVTPARVQIDIDKKFKVPLIIHQSHISYKLPKTLADMAQGWIDLNPEFEHRYYDDAAIADYVRKRGAPEFVRAFDHLAKTFPRSGGAFRADMFRVLALAEEGGVWIDADYKPRKPIANLLRPTDQFICGVDETGAPAPSFELIIAVPRHPFLISALDDIISARLYQRRVWKARYIKDYGYLGPDMFSRSVHKIAPRLQPGAERQRALDGYPGFTVTALSKADLGGFDEPKAFLCDHFFDESIDAIAAMGKVSYRRYSLREWSRIAMRDPLYGVRISLWRAAAKLRRGVAAVGAALAARRR